MKQNELWGSGLSPFFTPEDFLPSHPRVSADLETEILVIGGGLSGLLAAYELRKAGKEVVLVTANTVGDGACRFSSGIVCADGGADYLRLRELIGRENAGAWYRSVPSAVERLEKIVAETGSKCDFQRRDQFCYAQSDRNAGLLREEYYARRHLGYAVRWTSGPECREEFSFPCAGGFFTRGAATLNPVRLCRDLADWLTVHGGRIFEGSRVDVIESPGAGRFVCRCGGYGISASGVIDARGGEVLRKRPQLGQRVTVFSVVTQPVPVFRGWPGECVIKSHDGFSYLRITPDRRIVCSGAATGSLTPDGRLGRLDGSLLCRVKYKNILSELQDMLFGIPRLRQEYAFCQGMVLPKGGLPYVGQDAQWEGLYYLYAFGENGIAGAVTGASRIRSAICGGLPVPSYLSLQPVSRPASDR